MAGLLEKDYRLLMTRKTNVLIFILIGGMISFQAEGAFGQTYMTLLGTLLAISTLAYDDADNGMSFLLTLPCSRKIYVQEKYVFIYGVSLISWIMGSVVYGCAELTRGNAITLDLIQEMMVSAIPVFLMMGALMIPIQLKFGSERSRVVMLVIFGIIFAAVYAFASTEGGNLFMQDLLDRLDGLNTSLAFGGLFLIVLLVVILSYGISLRILEQKEY